MNSTAPAASTGWTEESVNTSSDLTPDALQRGSRVVGFRIEGCIEREEHWTLWLAADEDREELVVLAVSASLDALTSCLAGPARGVIVRQTTFGSWHIAAVALEESHLQRFAVQFLAIPKQSRVPTLPSPSAPVEMQLRDGSIFAQRYHVEGVLGRGGVGEVYRARDGTLERAVALKVVRVSTAEITADREEAERRLLKEARVVSALKHPNIVELYDVGESSGLRYLVLELCEGGNLRGAMADASQADRLRWLTEIAEALAYAHDMGVVHRDVKPENVLLTAEGVAKVADFGIAKALKPDRAQENTTTGIVGTPRYMAPEQLFGGLVDARADQFAWGLLACELLTGVHPRSGDIPALRAGQSLAVDPAVPTPLHQVLGRAMATDPKARYRDFHALCSDLRRPARRPAWIFIVGAIAALAATAVGVAAIARFSVSSNAAAPPAVTATAARGQQHEPPHQTDPRASLFARALPEDSSHPEARASYDAAIQLWTDASSQDALRALNTATEFDSSFGRAHLLYALIDDVTPDARQHYQQAAQHRSKLSTRERDLLDALSPSLHDPADLAGTRELLERLEQQLPSDLDIPLFIASRYLQAWEGERALPFADRAMKSPRPIAQLMRARALAKLNRLDESRAEYAECFASSPSATGCLRWNAKLDAGDGRCESVDNLGRRLIAAAPNNLDGYYFLAGGISGQSPSLGAVKAALEPRWLLAPSPVRPLLRFQDMFYLQVSAGAFDDAERTLDAWEADALRFSDADRRGRPAVERLLLNLELGRNEKAAGLARTYLEQSRAWTEGTSIVFDIEAYRVLYWTGAIDRTEFGRLRDEWLAASQRRPTSTYDVNLFRWYEGFVEPTVTVEDALLAVSRRPPGMEEPDREIMQTQSMQRLGRMYLLAGHVDEALVFLKRSVDACFYRYPFHQMWANLDYAIAVSQGGDSALALKSLDTISRRWGNSPRSKTNREARDLSARLRSRQPAEREAQNSR